MRALRCTLDRLPTKVQSSGLRSHRRYGAKRCLGISKTGLPGATALGRRRQVPLLPPSRAPNGDCARKQSKVGSLAKGSRGANFETSCCPWRCLATRSRQFDASFGFPGEGIESTWKQTYGHSDEKLLQTPASLSGVLYSLAHIGGAKLTSFLRDVAHAVREQGPGFPESCDTSASQGGSPVTEFLPLPYPEIYRAKRKAHPSDKRLANLTALVLNWLGAGSPSKLPRRTSAKRTQALG